MKRVLSVISLLLVMCTLATCLFGCSETSSESGRGKDKQETPDEITGTFSDSLILEKVGVVDREQFSVNAGGLTYKDNDTGKYGIISNDGVEDSGAIYEYVEAVGQYFLVMTKKASDIYDVKGLNSATLVDGRGRTIVGGGYADFEVYGRFVAAFTATLLNDEGTVFAYSDRFVSEPSGSARYKATWCVFDGKTGKEMTGITGEDYFSGFNKGNFLCYNNGNGYVAVHGDGIPAPDNSAIFDDGSYKSEGRTGEVFTDDGNKLFDYDLAGFVPSSKSGDYYIARRYVDGKTTYVVMDMTGKVVSTEYPEYITVEGNLVLCENKLMDFEGKAVYDGECNSVTLDRMFGNCYMVRSDDTYTMIDETGSVFLSIVYDDKNTMYTSEFVASKKTDDKYMFFNHGTQAFDIEGYSAGPWMVKQTDANYTYNLVDSMTGNVLLEGYSSYSYNARNPETYYIYAKYNGGADVFLASSASGFKPIIDMKADLIADLGAALETAGLSVTINRETGEIAMDASVLFATDSAEISQEGKDFLCKFVDVYCSVVFSEKYEGFVSQIMVEGHTDTSSSFEYNLELSQKRADNVRDFCLSDECGVDSAQRAILADMFVPIGYSYTYPVYTADGQVDMDASRRVAFRFLVSVEE